MVFQLSSALLDACVLAELSNEETYGYVLTQELKDRFELSESSLYPVLRRLQKEGCLVTRDRPFQGRNRRYYSITPQGVQKLAEYRGEWKDYRSRIDRTILGGTLDEPGAVSDKAEP